MNKMSQWMKGFNMAPGLAFALAAAGLFAGTEARAEEPDTAVYAEETEAPAFAQAMDTAAYAEAPGTNTAVYAEETEAPNFAQAMDTAAYAEAPGTDTAVYAEETETPAFAMEAETSAFAEETTVDFVLVLDRSGSMGSSDKEQLYVSAAKMFIDMLPTERARLAVVGFGEDYGREAWPMDVVGGGDQAWMNRQVRSFFDLQSITDQASKETAKDMVMRSSDSNGDYTPIGYALTAANDILLTGKARDGQACIILMSDGRITGQDADDKYNEGWDFHSVDSAAEEAADHGWPIYCLELNDDKVNDGTSSEGNVGRHIMREVIPEKTGTQQITLNEASQAEAAFADIFAHFFEAESSMTVATDTIENGRAGMNFDVEEMVAETTLTVTGDISQVTRIELVGPDGETETVDRGTAMEPDRQIVFEDRYVTLKLFAPREGRWTVNVYGTDGVAISLYAVSIRDMDLALSDDGAQAADGILPRGTEVTFRASYYYHDSLYESGTVYARIPARLIISGVGEDRIIEMTGTDAGYEASAVLEEDGTYEVRAVVENEMFRGDGSESNTLSYTVGNLPVTVTGTVPDQTMAVHDSLELDLKEYFSSPDGDALHYSLVLPEDSGADAKLAGEMDPETGILSLRSGALAGETAVTAEAADDDMDQPARQTFTVRVENQPLCFTEETGAGPDEVTIERSVSLVLPGRTLPGFVMKAAGIEGEPDHTVNYADLFTDPDDPDPEHLQVVCEADPENAEGIRLEETDPVHMKVSADKKGTAVFRITAADANAPEVVRTVVLTVTAAGAWSLLLEKYWLPLAIAAAVIIAGLILFLAAFGGRKLYGIWDITCGGEYITGRKLGATRYGKKSRCRLDQLLGDLELDGGFGSVEVAAGNNFNKMVYFKNMDGLDYVAVDENEVTGKSGRRKTGIGRKHSIRLERDGRSVTFERH